MRGLSSNFFNDDKGGASRPAQSITSEVEDDVRELEHGELRAAAAAAGAAPWPASSSSTVSSSSSCQPPHRVRKPP